MPPKQPLLKASPKPPGSRPVPHSDSMPKCQPFAFLFQGVFPDLDVPKHGRGGVLWEKHKRGELGGVVVEGPGVATATRFGYPNFDPSCEENQSEDPDVGTASGSGT